jgi:hypothetical protein
MTNKGMPAFTLALSALIAASCGVNPNGGYKQVDYGLRGTWESMKEAYWPESYPWEKKKGFLALDYGAITITGPVAHLQGFTRDIALEAYTEDAGGSGLLYIKDRGILQSPVSYRRWQSVDNPKKEMLTLTGGGLTEETFKRIKK